MKQLGLIGYPLSHSFSKKYFDEKFQKLNLSDFSFSVFSMENINQFPALLNEHKKLIGLSVTIPHKETVIPFLDEVDEVAKEIGAVNCIKISNGKLKGYNTDALGFKQSLRPFLDVNHTRALVFGTGGAAKAVAYVLKKLNIDVWFVTRKKNIDLPNSFTYEELNEEIVAACKLLVNTTPVGMHPNINECPALPYQAITPQHLVYDLTYNPAETLFLKKAKEQGALISNGYNMLCFQADEAWRIWNE
ncbi:MAG TPA: shikimate dehydrogenase [Bacteroidia bacterium]|jgi:shikimate dehydrogenase|nr:shikimate dehydrogenase [Bacteroidia bacterium]